MAREIRGDIQGLRALAVLTVIAGHAGVTFLPGGFVGVDVFFVISGYLISGLLFREVLGNGRFSLTTFYARRARRILPAATLVTVATVVASLFVLSLIDARQVVIDAVWSAAFAANFNFAQQDVSYFSQGSGVSPLQHYWSLAVEEQFYVVWPLLLLLCLGLVKLARRGRPDQRRLPRRAVFAMLFVVTAASFTWSVVQTAERAVGGVLLHVDAGLGARPRRDGGPRLARAACADRPQERLRAGRAGARRHRGRVHRLHVRGRPSPATPRRCPSWARRCSSWQVPARPRR